PRSASADFCLRGRRDRVRETILPPGPPSCAEAQKVKRLKGLIPTLLRQLIALLNRRALHAQFTFDRERGRAPEGRGAIPALFFIQIMLRVTEASPSARIEADQIQKLLSPDRSDSDGSVTPIVTEASLSCHEAATVAFDSGALLIWHGACLLSIPTTGLNARGAWIIPAEEGWLKEARVHE